MSRELDLGMSWGHHGHMWVHSIIQFCYRVRKLDRIDSYSEYRKISICVSVIFNLAFVKNGGIWDIFTALIKVLLSMRQMNLEL